MTFAELQSLLEQIAAAVARLRQTLETNNMDALPDALEQTRVALELINGYPEGPEKLKADINQYPKSKNKSCINYSIKHRSITKLMAI